jgi:hypothetical protein
MSDDLETTSASGGESPTLRPFWGHFRGEATFPESEACRDVHGQPFQTVTAAQGEMTSLGPTTYSGTHCATLDNHSVRGEATLTAADGDQVRAAYMGRAVAPPPLIVVQAEWTIIGGTGRFEGATGRAVGMAYVTFEGFDVPAWPLERAVAGMIAH